VSPPGTEYHYSNLGYSILAAIIEEASGMGYEEFLAEELFAPAEMTQTGYVLPH
jgi:CubicO group peptidase (beta-lactamase class C family)